MADMGARSEQPRNPNGTVSVRIRECKGCGREVRTEGMGRTRVWCWRCSPETRTTGKRKARKRVITDDMGNATLYKECTSCRSWLEITAENFPIRRRDKATGLVREWNAECRPCANARQRREYSQRPLEERLQKAQDYYERLRSDPSRWKQALTRKTASRRRWLAAMDPERREAVLAAEKERKRRYWDAVRADPVRHERYLQDRRIDSRGRAVAEGRDIASVKVALGAYRPVMNGTTDRRLPVLPLSLWLWTVTELEVPDLGRPQGGGQRDDRSRTLDDLAAELGVHVRQMKTIRALEYDTVTLNLADRMLTRYGRPVVLRGDRAAEAAAERCWRMAGNGERILRYIDMADLIAERVGLVVSGVGDLWSDEQLAGEDRHAILTAWEM